MRLRQFARTCAASAALAIAVGAFTPAMAQDNPQPGTAPPGPDQRPDWRGDQRPPYPPEAYRPYAMDPHAREAWLDECHRRISASESRVPDTAARRAIDKAEHDRRPRDECEAYLDNYYAYYARGGYRYGYPGYAYRYPAYGYGYPGGCCYAGPMVMVPVIMVPTGKPKCKETVEYEYVDVPRRPRYHRVPDKRIRIIPDKRIKVVPDKRVPAN